MPKKFKIKNNTIQLNARCYSPKGKEQQKLPTIILSHEFGTNMWSTARYAKLLIAGGDYHVFLFDFSGSGSGFSTGRKSTEMSVLTEVEDLHAVIDYVKAQPYVDTDQLFLGGCSQGGLVTALTAANRTAEIKKIFLIYPALSIPDDVRKGTVLGKRIDLAHIPEKFRVIYLFLGRKYVEDALKIDPWKEIIAYQKPVFISHGDQDTIVDYHYTLNAQKQYNNCQIQIIPGAKHMYFLKGKKEAITSVLNFLKN